MSDRRPDKYSIWVDPVRLREIEKRERTLVDRGEFDGGGNFGAYYAYRKGINKNWVPLYHSIDKDQEARLVVDRLKLLLSHYGVELKGKSILDIGCGIGSITNILNYESENGKVYGVDIAEDAISIAKAKYPNCSYLCKSASGIGQSIKENSLDLIYAKGFQPFCSTSDADAHLKQLEIFSNILRPGGWIIFEMVCKGRGLERSLRSLSNKDFIKLNLNYYGKFPIVSLRIFQYVNCSVSIILLRLLGRLSNLLAFIRGAGTNNYYIYRKMKEGKHG